MNPVSVLSPCTFGVWWKSLASRLLGAFPIAKEGSVRTSLETMGRMLDMGRSVLIFPEGQRTDTGSIDRFRAGIGMIASRLGVPVVPVRIDGLEKVLHHTWNMARPGRVRVAFGAPTRLVGDEYEALTRQVEEAVRAL